MADFALFSALKRVTRPVRRRWGAMRALHRIFQEFGYIRSLSERAPVDVNGKEVPWFTYPAIEYLRQLDLSQKTVFEFGSGHSSIFWSRLAARVVSVENDPVWYKRVKTTLGGNAELHLIESPSAYSNFITLSDEKFDIVVVDGIERRKCCEAALKRLRPGGMIILDNADWFQNCSRLLRSEGLLEVDMSGFGPVNDYTWTTSFYFHREFAFASLQDLQPVHGVGALPHREANP